MILPEITLPVRPKALRFNVSAFAEPRFEVGRGVPAEPRILKAHDVTIRTGAFSKDGRLLATGSSDQSIKVWDVATGRNVFTFRGHEDGVCPVVFSPDGTRLASGSADQTIKIWDMQTRQQVLTLKARTGAVLSVALNAERGLLVSGSDDRIVRIFEARTMQADGPE